VSQNQQLDHPMQNLCRLDARKQLMIASNAMHPFNSSTQLILDGQFFWLVSEIIFWWMFKDVTAMSIKMSVSKGVITKPASSGLVSYTNPAKYHSIHTLITRHVVVCVCASYVWIYNYIYILAYIYISVYIYTNKHIHIQTYIYTPHVIHLSDG
jgi:hypothetical protein